MNFKHPSVWLFLSAMLLSAPLLAQRDSIDSRKNTIRYDIIPHTLYDQSYVFSYERITGAHESFVITAGYLEFPNLTSLGSRIGVRSDEKSGLTFGGEYRFYLHKENKYKAPHGVYIGPYSNAYIFKNDRNLEIKSEDGMAPTYANLKSDIVVVNFGFQMGYQFVIKNRFTIDMVFAGPSFSLYSLKSRIDGNYDISDNELAQEILTALVDKFPLVGDLLEDKEIDLQGSKSTFAPGWRYQLNIGYRFGGGKKGK